MFQFETIAGWIMLGGFFFASIVAVVYARMARKSRAGAAKAKHAKETWYMIGVAVFFLVMGVNILFIVNYQGEFAGFGSTVSIALSVLAVCLSLVAFWRYRKAARSYEEAAVFDQWMWRVINGPVR